MSATAVTVTYVLYIAAELPSNLLLKKLGPKILLSGLCLSWGIVTTLQCLVNNYSGLLAARLMLGMAEGGTCYPPAQQDGVRLFCCAAIITYRG